MQKGFAPILAIIGILILVAVGYIIVIGFPEKTHPGAVLSCHGIPINNQCLGYKSVYMYVDGPAPKSEELRSIPADETANWKTYTNTKYNYSFKYPSSLTPYVFSGGQYSLGKEDDVAIVLMSSSILSTWNDSLPYAFSISVLDTTQHNTLKKKLDSLAQKAPCAGCPQKSISQINGVETTIYDGYGGYLLEKIFLLEHSGKFYEIGRMTGEETPVYSYSIFNQILSTFKFLP